MFECATAALITTTIVLSVHFIGFGFTRRGGGFSVPFFLLFFYIFCWSSPWYYSRLSSKLLYSTIQHTIRLVLTVHSEILASVFLLYTVYSTVQYKRKENHGLVNQSCEPDDVDEWLRSQILFKYSLHCLLLYYAEWQLSVYKWRFNYIQCDFHYLYLIEPWLQSVLIKSC